MTTTRGNIEEIDSTKSERFLAVILSIFILIGGGWTYAKLPSWVDGDRLSYTSAERRVISERDRTATIAEDLQSRRDSARSDLDLARSDLQLATEQHQDTTKLSTTYRRAQRTYNELTTRAATAEAAAKQASTAAKGAEQARSRRSEGLAWLGWLTAALRIALIVAFVAGGLRLLRRLRERDSRFLPLSYAVVAAGTILAMVFAVDYITDYVNPLDLGPIVLSALGAAVTVAAFVGLQRYLTRRIPRSRVRKGECPFCSFPVRDQHRLGSHCEGCGRPVIAHCATCAEPRRVGTPHCAGCGAA